MGCDGIYDVLSNQEVTRTVEETIDLYKKISKDYFKNRTDKNYNNRHSLMKKSINQRFLTDVCDNVLKLSLVRNSEDNVSVIFIAFTNLLDS